MAPHAGFAAVLGISQTVLQDTLRSAYLANQLPHKFQVNAGAAGLVELATDFFSDAPEVVLSSDHPTALLIGISAWGPLTITLPRYQNGALVLVPEIREVLFKATLEAPLLAEISDGGLVLGFDPAGILLLDKSFTAFAGGDFSLGARTLLATQLFHNMLEQALRDNLNLSQGFPPIDIAFLDPFLGPLMQNPHAEVVATARGFTGALVIGIDVYAGLTGTAGNPSQLSNTVGDLGMTVWVNPGLWVPNMQQQLLEGTDTTAGVRDQVANAGATLDLFELELREGRLHVRGKAHKGDLGSVTFSFDVVPQLTRPAVYIDLGEDEDGQPATIYLPAREELWFEITNVAVDVHRPWWTVVLEVLLGILTAGIATLVAEAFVTLIRNNIIAEIMGGSGGESENLTTTFQPVPGGPLVTAKIEAFEFHEAGIFLGMSVRTDFKLPAVYSPSHGGSAAYPNAVVDADEVRRGVALDFAVRLPHLVAADDPYLRIRWTVRKADDNTILLNSDEPAQANLTASITNIANALSLRVSCRVFRVLGVTVTDFFDGALNVAIADRLDRRHPFVRWYHYAYTPDVEVAPDGSHTVLGGHIKYRESQIHRTDIPGRCLMASRYSLGVPREFRPPPNRQARLVYLDALPFNPSRIRDYRHLVCEYCFFGGPANTAPLPLPR